MKRKNENSPYFEVVPSIIINIVADKSALISIWKYAQWCYERYDTRGYSRAKEQNTHHMLGGSDWKMD